MPRLLMLLATLFSAAASVPFRIDCVDGQTGRGVPLVKLTTSGYISYYSDSAGVVAFDEPGMLGGPVFFLVTSDGYANAATPPGSPQPGVLLETMPGGRATVVLNRTQPAERVYRLTGGGLYRDTILVGGTAPVAEPLLSRAGVLGQDSLMGLVYKNRSFWFFGDTECPAGPRNSDCQHYGMFTTGATADAAQPGLQPPSLAYFTSNNSRDPGGMGRKGRPDKAMIEVWNPHSFSHPKPMLAGPGIIPNFADNSWVGSATVIKEAGEEKMYLTYVCPNTQLQGLALWSDEDEHFRPVHGPGYAMRYSGAQWVQKLKPADEGYAYYASAFANVRVKAMTAAIEDPAQYEYFTPCHAIHQGGCNVSMGAASWGWKRSDLGKPGGGGQWQKFGPLEERAAIVQGRLRAADARMQVRDRATGKPLQPAGVTGLTVAELDLAHAAEVPTLLARGSVNWNAYRSKYVLVADQSTPQRTGGSNRGQPSVYGELWYCEVGRCSLGSSSSLALSCLLLSLLLFFWFWFLMLFVLCRLFLCTNLTRLLPAGQRDHRAVDGL